MLADAIGVRKTLCVVHIDSHTLRTITTITINKNNQQQQQQRRGLAAGGSSVAITPSLSGKACASEWVVGLLWRWSFSEAKSQPGVPLILQGTPRCQQGCFGELLPRHLKMNQKHFLHCALKVQTIPNLSLHLHGGDHPWTECVRPESRAHHWPLPHLAKIDQDHGDRVEQPRTADHD